MCVNAIIQKKGLNILRSDRDCMLSQYCEKNLEGDLKKMGKISHKGV